MLNKSGIPLREGELGATLSYADPATPRPRQLGASAGITRGDIAILAVKLLGIYLILAGLIYLVQVLTTLVGFGGSFAFGSLFTLRAIVVELSMLALYEGVGLGLVFRGDQIGLWLLPRTLASDLGPPAGSAMELQSAAFAVVGVLAALWAIPESAFNVWRYLYEASRTGASTNVSEFVLAVVKPGVQIIAGAWLFFGSKRLARFWQRVRAERIRADDDSAPL